MLASLVLLWICICLIFIQLKSRRPKNFPPGPTALPFLGNLLNLSLDNPLNYIETLRKKYGNVFSVYIGHKPVVVLNGIQALKESLVNKAVDFAGRPDMFLLDVFERRGVLFTDYGPALKEHRRFVMMTLRNFGLGKQSMEERILGELQYTVNDLQKNNGQTVNPQVMLNAIISNVICLVLFSTRYEHDDEFVKKLVSSFVGISKTVNGTWAFVYDSLPWVKSLPLPFTKAFKAVQTMKDIIIPIINEHKRTRVPGQPRDFVDCYLEELDKRGNDGSSFSSDDLLMICIILHVAGTDSTANAILTGFLYLSTMPHIQERCQQEIDQVLEGKDFVSFEDRHNIPYVQAVVYESLRIGSPVPLAVFHATTKDTELMGYSIPKGTIIIPNLSSALSEEGQWKFPHEFNPENFLNDKGEFVKPDAFMPFSAGPQACIGEALARMIVFLIMVTLLRKFKFTWPEDAGEPDYTPLFGITLMPKPYSMKVELRAPQ